MSYTQHNVPGPEYRVRPVVRYVVTRYCHPYVHEEGRGAHSVCGGSEVIGEFHREENAYAVANAMDEAEKSEPGMMLRAPGDPVNGQKAP